VRGVLIHADDFGQSAGINRGIIDAHERGVVTSASLMVRGAAAAEAAGYVRAHPGLSAGLHVDLGEWSCQQGTWVCVYERVNGADAAAVATEIDDQIARFRDLIGRGPTHLDSHQHVHKDDPARAILIDRAAALDVPLRHFSLKVMYEGAFYGQAADGRALHDLITAAQLALLLRRVSPGITEVGCHPGYADDVVTMYRDERAVEVAALCAPGVRRVFEETDVRLMSFRDVSRSRVMRPGVELR
jgi:predicted glycoside hydrolase/deacetylase ChbG (UPF0249 family)